jgi:hypothetical protein
MTAQEENTTAANKRTATLDRVLRYAVQKGGVRSNQIELAETRWGVLVDRLSQMQLGPRVDNPESVPALIYADFKAGATRRDVDVLAMTALVLDIDKDANLDQLRAALTGRECAIYTTKRSTCAALRLRAVLPLAVPVSARDWSTTYRQSAAELTLSGLDPCAEKLSQPFLAPPGGGYFEHLTGEWLDPGPYISAARLAEYDALPQPEPIRITLLSVPPLDPDLIPDAFREWIADTAYRMQCPIDFCAVGAIGILAAVVGAGIGIKPKRKDDWLIVPNLWGGVIGPPSKKKTPALAEMVKALGRLEKLATDSTQQAKATAADPETKARQKAARSRTQGCHQGRHARQAHRQHGRRLCRSHHGGIPDRRKQRRRRHAPAKRKAPSRQRLTVSTDTQRGRDQARNGQHLSTPPTGNLQERFRTNDATIEALHDLLSTNGAAFWSSVTNWSACCAAGTSKGANRIAAFTSKRGTARAAFPLDRIGRGHVICDNMCVSILGGTQPDKVRNYLYQARIENDGMMQRFQLLTYPDVQPFVHMVDEYPDAPARERAFAIIETLARTDFAMALPRPAPTTKPLPALCRRRRARPVHRVV